VEWTNKKKADPVGIGLLKEGDDACVLSEKQPAGFIRPARPRFQSFVDGLLSASIHIDAKTHKKLQHFSQFLKKSPKKGIPGLKKYIRASAIPARTCEQHERPSAESLR
jgi:hypothetical protein